MHKRIILIDVSNLAFRAFHTHADLTTSKGIGTGMCFGSIQSLIYLFCKYNWQSKEVILVRDGRPQWKYDLFPEYKHGRKKTDLPDKMSIPLQMKLTKYVLSLMGLNHLENLEQEADDLIASFVHRYKNVIDEIIIVGSDHDFQQVLQPGVKMMHCGRNGEDYTTEKDFVDKYGILPDDYWKVQALAGCTTDKVPGMSGIGEKSAFEIITENGWQKILQNDVDLHFKSKRNETIFRKNHKDWNHKRDTKLVKLQKDLPISITKNSFQRQKLREWFVKLQFKQYLDPNAFKRICQVFGGLNG